MANKVTGAILLDLIKIGIQFKEIIMLTRESYPPDIRDGRTVKEHQLENIRDAGDP
jgi:hypothetical protein